MYLGSWKIDDNLTFPCNTHSPTTGAGTDADSVPSYRVYEDETGTPLLTGSMAKLDDANTVGFYSEQIALSAANGFEKGKSYTIYVSATVSSVTGTMSHSFQIEAEVDANRLNWANVDNPTTTVGLSGTSIKTATDVETDTADIQSKIGTPAGASVSADIADVEGKVDDLETRLGTPSDLGSGATIAANLVDIENQTDDIPAILEDTGTTLPATLSTIEGKIDTVDGIVDNILTDTAEIGAAGAGLTALPWNAAWDAEVQSEVQDAIEANHLDHLLAADYDPASKPGVATALLNELVESDGGVSRFTANALQQAPSGSGVGDWTSDEKEQIRYRLQLDGTQTAPAADAPLQMPVSADAISQDETAADNLEAMLDGTRAKLYLSQLDITASGSDTALKLIGGPAGGGGIFCQGKSASAAAFISDTGKGMHIQGDGGIFIAATNPVSYAVDVEGEGTGVFIGGFDGSALILDGQGISGQDLEFANSKCIIPSLGTQAKTDVENAVLNAALSGHTTAGTAGERLGRIPNAAAGGNGGLPTVDASNQVAGVSGNVVGSIGSLAAQAKADVNAEVDTALADYDPPTHAELTAALAALNNLSAAEVQTKIEEFWQQFQLPELAAGQSPAEATPAEILAFLWMYFRGPQQSEKTGETTGIQRVHNDAGDIVLDAAFTKTETEYSREKLSLGD